MDDEVLSGDDDLPWRFSDSLQGRSPEGMPAPFLLSKISMTKGCLWREVCQNLS